MCGHLLTISSPDSLPCPLPCLLAPGLLEIEKAYRDFISSSAPVQSLWDEVTLLLVRWRGGGVAGGVGWQGEVEGTWGGVRLGVWVGGSAGGSGECPLITSMVYRLPLP